MMFLTTTAIDIDEELMNRCLVLTVDEDRAQTRAIHRLQREKRTLPGLVQKAHKQHILALHRNAQRLLRPLAVVNPYADQLTFVDDRTRTRRDHEKYLTLIDSIALLHQYQRRIHTTQVGGKSIDYIEVSIDDIALANGLAHDVLGRSLDELPPQTRRVLAALYGFIATQVSAQQLRQADIRFSRAEVRQACGLSDTQCRLHLERLIGLEYVLVHRGQRGQSFEYELLYDGQGESGKAFVTGLIDVATLQASATTASSRGQTLGFTGSSRPVCGPDAARMRPSELAVEPGGTALAAALAEVTLPTPLYCNGAMGTSYLQEPVLPLAAAV